MEQQNNLTSTKGDFLDWVAFVLNGKGFLERTSLFIGWYPANLSNSESYDVHLAYILCIICAYAISSVYVIKLFAVWLFLRREKENLSEVLNKMIFSGWDFTIVNKETADTWKKLQRTEIAAAFHENDRKVNKSQRTQFEEFKLTFLRVCLQLLSVILIFGGWTAIFFVVKMEKENNNTNFFAEYLDTLTISGLNLILPPIFFVFSLFEQYKSKNALLLYIMRLITVRLLSIVILVISVIFTRVDESETSNIDPCVKDNRCWETHLAQQIYSLLIFDALLHVPIAMFVVFRNWLRSFGDKNRLTEIKLFALLWEFLKNPEFDTGGQVLRIVNLQTLCWTGLVCAPMIPLIAVFSLVIMILLNGATVYFCELRPETVYRSSTSSSTFILALLVGLIVSFIPATIILVQLKPSLGCSPFRGLEYPYQSLVNEICKAPSLIRLAHSKK